MCFRILNFIFVFDVLAIGFLLAGDHTTTTFWRDVEFLQNCGHRPARASVAATGSEIGVLELAAEDELKPPQTKRARLDSATDEKLIPVPTSVATTIVGVHRRNVRSRDKVTDSDLTAIYLKADDLHAARSASAVMKKGGGL